MAQHDYVIDNQTFPATRSDINDALAAIVSTNAGATAPSTTYAYQLWYDTTADILKMRNADDDAWITLFTFDQATDSVQVSGEEVVDDTTPELGGNLDAQTFDITNVGNVGIGTSSPSAKLDVNGTIYSRTGGVYTDTITAYSGSSVSVNAGSSNFNVVVNTAERMRINSSGNVGIGTTSPQGILGISGGSNPQVILNNSDGTSNDSHDFRIGTFAGTTPFWSSLTLDASSHRFKTFGAERMRINSSGNVGIGTTSPAYKLQVGDGTANTRAVFSPNNAFAIGVSNSANFAGWIGGSGVADNMVFSNSGGTERVRIDSSGRVKIGTTSTVSTATAEQFAVDAGTSGGYGGVFASNTSGGYACIYAKAGTNVSNLAYFYKNTTLVGSITTNGSTTSYNTSSDYRLKENVTDITGATDRLKQLNPVRFNFIADADTTVDGFLAHEVQDVVPEAITGTKDAVDGDGNPVYQGIDQSKLVPLLVATIQELEARIAALEAN